MNIIYGGIRNKIYVSLLSLIDNNIVKNYLLSQSNYFATGMMRKKIDGDGVQEKHQTLVCQSTIEVTNNNF